MNLRYINTVISDYERWIDRAEAQGVDASDLKGYLEKWKRDRDEHMKTDNDTTTPQINEVNE